ncbi:regulator of ime2 [Lecanora helva]
MLRPATPLTVLFFVAFCLLLLSTISTPIVKGIPLAKFNGVTFGVFGYCKQSGCSKIQIGYPVDAKSLFGDTNDDADFSLPSTARTDLSAILIVHPVAALLTLICLILAATSHLHSPSHSPRYLLALIILSVPTLLITLLAFLVDILLFVPHLAWGGWIVLASTLLILASGIVTCAMRRTLVGRKARKKRIAENAEMNGENFYARQAAPPKLAMDRAESPPPLPQQSSMSGGVGHDKLPTFATYETKPGSDDDRIPLNSRTPSDKTLPSAPGSRGGYSEDGYNRFGAPARGGRGVPGSMRGGRGGYNGPRDEYGNPLPPSNAFGPMPPAGMRRDRSEPPRLRNQYSDETLVPPWSRGRGRGGYGPPRGYGRGGPRGGPYGPGAWRGRGGYGRGGIPMGPMAAGAGAGMMANEWRQGQEPPPPPGYGYGNGYAQERPGQFDGPGPAGYGRSPFAPGYGRRPSPGPPSAPGAYGRRPSPGPPSAPGAYGRRPSPGPPSAPGGGYGYAQREPSPEPPMPQYRNEPSPPLPGVAAPIDDHMIGQAIEMDARHGSPSLRSPTFPHQNQLRDSDSDVQGFVGLQQKQRRHDSTSDYGGNEPYVPPRAAWTTNGTRGLNSPPNTSPLAPVELPSQSTPRNQRPRSTSLPQSPPSHRRKQSSADDYYEDVDPRFASPPPHENPQHLTQTSQTTQSSGTVPHALMPGISTTPSHHLHQPIHPTIEHANDPHSSYEDFTDGQPLSPAESDSNMTSISQRGVNPNWRPDSTHRPGQSNLDVPGRRPSGPQQLPQHQQQRDLILGSNPDFEIPPGATPPSRAPGGVPIIQHGQAF